MMVRRVTLSGGVAEGAGLCGEEVVLEGAVARDEEALRGLVVHCGEGSTRRNEAVASPVARLMNVAEGQVVVPIQGLRWKLLSRLSVIMAMA